MSKASEDLPEPTAGQDDQPVARKIYADIGKIVLARTAHGDHTGLGPHHGVVTGVGMNIGSRRQCAVKQLTGGWRVLFVSFGIARLPGAYDATKSRLSRCGENNIIEVVIWASCWVI